MAFSNASPAAASDHWPRAEPDGVGDRVLAPAGYGLKHWKLGGASMSNSMAVDWSGTLYTVDFPRGSSLNDSGRPQRIWSLETPWEDTEWTRSTVRATTTQGAAEIVAGGDWAYVQYDPLTSAGSTVRAFRSSLKTYREYLLDENVVGKIRSIVATKRTGELYVLAQNGLFRAPMFDDNTYEIRIGAQHRVRSSARKVFAGLDTIYATDTDTRAVYRFDPNGNSWSWFHAPVRDLDVDRGGVVYITDDNGSDVYQKYPGQKWQKIVSSFGEDAILSAGRTGELFLTGEEGGDIFKYTGKGKAGVEVFADGHFAPWDVYATEGGVIYRPWSWQGPMRGIAFVEEPIIGEEVSANPAPVLGGGAVAGLLLGLGGLGLGRRRRWNGLSS